MLEEGFYRVGLNEDRNACKWGHGEVGIFGDSDKLLGVVQIPLRGVTTLLRVWGLLLVQRAFGRMLCCVVRDRNAFCTALHAHKEQHHAKDRDGAQE